MERKDYWTIDMASKVQLNTTKTKKNTKKRP